MQTSTYQLLKIHLMSLINISKDAFHIYIGFFTYAIFATIARRYVASFKLLIPVVILSLVMEALDFRDDYTTLGYIRFQDSLKDLINTNLIPFILVVLAKAAANRP